MNAPLLHDLFIRPDFDNSRITVSFTRPEDCREFEYQKILDGNRAKSSGTIQADRSTATIVFDDVERSKCPHRGLPQAVAKLLFPLTSGRYLRLVLRYFMLKRVSSERIMRCQ